MNLHVGFAGPITVAHVSSFLDQKNDLPIGYTGAPIMGTLIQQLLLRGYHVSAFTTDSSLYKKDKTLKFSGKNFDLYVCPARPKAWRFNGFRLGRAVDGFSYEIKKLKEAMELANPDILHAHWTYEFALAAQKTTIPNLITCHDSPGVVLKFNKNPYRSMRYLMARAVFSHAKQLTTVSDYMMHELKKYSNLEIEIIPNPLADYVLTNQTVRESPITKKIVMVCNGWDKRKNPEIAICAFNKFLSLEPSAELHLYGASFGVGEAAYHWAKDRNLDANIIFHGAVPHKQLVSDMRSYDMLLHTALEESFGVVIAEAMALGLPVVAGESSGAVPWVMGRKNNNVDCGVLVNVSDINQIVQAIQKIFDNDYNSRSNAGIQIASSTFTPELVAEKYIQRYNKVLSEVNHA